MNTLGISRFGVVRRLLSRLLRRRRPVPAGGGPRRPDDGDQLECGSLAVLVPVARRVVERPVSCRPKTSEWFSPTALDHP
ncbi:MAG TPA: hypothetical protein VHH34_13480 [Pseudonocardiaceae bacterium]|nr:hypothetical protein [Pseudonocardiaceae bacterium]